MNNKDHMRISGTGPSIVIITQKSGWKSWKVMPWSAKNKLKPKGML